MLNKLHPIRVVFFALTAFFSSPIFANTFHLDSGEWEMLTLPADSSQTTISNLFENALNASDYDTDSSDGLWRIWKYDSVSGDYIDPGINGQLNPGEGFWMIQFTDTTVILDVSTLPAVSATTSTECATMSGCFAAPVSTNAGALAWSMLGSPFSWSAPVDDLRLKTAISGDDCFGGCTLEQAFELPQPYTDERVWFYDNSLATPDYTELSAGDTIPTWQGFWFVATEATANADPVLLIPDTSAITQVSLRVATPAGEPLVNVAIESVDGTIDTQTNMDGVAEFSMPSGDEFVLHFDLDGYAKQVAVVGAPPGGGVVSRDVTMLEHQLSTTFDAGAGINELVGPDGSFVSVPGNAFVDDQGALVQGLIKVTMTSVDVGNRAERRAFPGNFQGMSSTQTSETLVSQGTVEFTFSQNGEEVQLAPNRTVFIELPIYTTVYPGGTPITAGDSIPLWSLNETTGIWEQEGSGTVVESQKTSSGFALQAVVSHFSWWNCDVAAQTGLVRVKVVGPGTGTAVVKGSTNASIGWRPSEVSTSVSVGVFTMPLNVPANEEVCYMANVDFDDGSSAITPTICTTVQQGQTIDVILGATDGPFDLFVSLPDSSGSTGMVNGNIYTPIDPVFISPGSHESEVTYVVETGALPPGLALRPVRSVSASIEGVPTQSGIYNISIVGTNSDSEQITVDLVYNIAPIPLAPALDRTFGDTIFISNFNFIPLDSTVYMANYNGGGFATEWTLVSDSPGGLPSNLSFNETTGVVNLLNWGVFQSFSGTLVATNSQGSDEVELFISSGGDF